MVLRASGTRRSGMGWTVTFGRARFDELGGDDAARVLSFLSVPSLLRLLSFILPRRQHTSCAFVIYLRPREYRGANEQR
jgi:hypothetical protein